MTSTQLAADPGVLADMDAVQARMAEVRELLDEGAVGEILSLCKQDWPKLLRLSQDQLVARNFSLLRETIHRLAGSALQVGAADLGQLCRRFEGLLRTLSAATPTTEVAATAHGPQQLISVTAPPQVSSLFAQIQQRVDGLLARL